MFALATLAVGANAQVTFSGGTTLSAIAGYGPNGTAGSLVNPGGKSNASITTSSGLLAATFLGFEALDTDTYSFSTARRF